MYFRDRIHAGEQLATELIKYKDIEDGIVIGLPRGGVPVAFEVARTLHLPLDIVCPRKIGAPFNPEYAIGAITETGEGEFNQYAISSLDVSEEYIQEEVQKEKAQAQHRLELYRKGLPSRTLKNKVVFLVDDGIATGSTMRAAIRSVRGEGAQKIIMAVPVSPPDAFREISGMVDEAVCLETPSFFQAVGQFYEQFGQTADEEVIELMKLANEQ